MTDKMIAVPRELLEELRDCAELCADDVREHDLGEDSAEAHFRQVGRACDALLREAPQPSEQQPSPDVSDLVEALEGILPFVVDEPWECRGDKCREVWCISCFGDEEACESAAKAKQSLKEADSVLADYRNQGDGK